ncbi:cytochrome ubiquinol oxidase subunit I [Gaopeijia maritima]|uniref:Cytochrome ubiquinol oxidase subunit I n=1 Tax=Gaopeijia maritima TaxID=3119007 RepID=A0ABU9EB52_9BACT
MTDLLAARSQMAVSLAFHIVFAAIGIGLPALMLVSEALWLRTGRDVYLRLTRAWSRGLAVLFAVGAVSGTVLSFELGLLWPRFMEVAGPLVGMPFSLEGLAFFTEAIFLGIYLYGWKRVSRGAHFAAGVVVALSGAASALFVLSVNGWMNSPTGFIPGDPGSAPVIDPVAAMTNPFWIANTVHMLIAAYTATAFGAAAVHAWRILKGADTALHHAGLRIALVVGAVMALLQPLSGDVTARLVAHEQPAKLAAMEAHFETGPCAPLRIGGWPDEATGTVRFDLEIPCGLSLLVGHSPDAVVTGLNDIPADERPPVLPVHIAFQVMVGIGTLLAAMGVWTGVRLVRRLPLHRPLWFLRLAVVAGPLAFVAIQAGWVVTEVGRQPWIIYGVMRTEDAVTPMPGLVVPFTAFTLLYVFLSWVVVVLMRRIARMEDAEDAEWSGGSGDSGAAGEAGA